MRADAPTTIVHALRRHADAGLDSGYLFTDGDRDLDHLSYGALDLGARRVAALLRLRHLPGQRALLLYPPGLDFLTGFFGCLYAGLVPVPAYPPDPARLGRTLPRLSSIVEDASAGLVLTTAAVRALADAMPDGVGPLRRVPWYASDEAARDPGGAALAMDKIAAPAPGDLAFLQYTSGSVGEPKGVRVSHGNIVHNVRAMDADGGSWGAQHRIVGWTPLFHDLGLILNSLMPLYFGARSFLLSPLDFLREPGRWLRAITRYRGIVSGGPNFAYDLCVRRVPEAERRSLDLSSWEAAFNSAEPVRADTLSRFAAAFAPCGFRETALMPCYGLAETTLAVAQTPRGEGARLLHVEGAALAGGRVRPAPNGRALVSSGRASLGMRLRIVDPVELRPCAADEVGEIWVHGPSVALGYEGRPALTAETFGARLPDGEGPYLRSGDLGFLHDGHLYVTGRRKDLIILRGRNHYPQDIERSVERAHPALRPGCAVAFALDPEGEAAEERLAVVAEVQPGAAPAEVAAAIVGAVAAEHEVQVSRVALLPPRTLPKTSSGKLQRRGTRADLLAGALPAVLDLAGPALLAAYLRACVAAVAGAPAASLPADRPLAALGVDSLGMAELATSLRGLGVELEEDEIGAGLSLADLGQRLRAPGGPEVQDGAALDEAAEAESLDTHCTHTQEDIYADHVRAPGSHVISIGLRLQGGIDPAAVGPALAALVDRHPLLGASFAPAGGVLRVRPLAARAPAIDIVDATGWGPAALHERLAEEAVRPLDVTAGPPVRALVLRRGPDESLVQLCLHHLVYDAATVLRLVEALAAQLLGRPEEAAPAPGHGRLVAWERRYLASAAGIATTRRRREELRGAPLGVALGAPTGPRRQDQVRITLPADGVARRARDADATPFAALLAAFALALRELTGQADLTVGSAVSLRDEPALAALVGPVFQYVPVRCAIGDAADLPAALHEVAPAVRQALAARRVPLSLLRADLPAAGSPVALGLNVNCNYYELDRLGGALGLGAAGALAEGPRRIATLPLADLPVVRPYDLNLGVLRRGGVLQAGLRYRVGLLTPGEAAALLGRVEAALLG